MGGSGGVQPATLRASLCTCHFQRQHSRVSHSRLPRYRHALPPGYVLKRDMKKDDDEEKISMEQLVEEERQNLLKSLKPGQTLTKVRPLTAPAHCSEADRRGCDMVCR